MCVFNSIHRTLVFRPLNRRCHFARGSRRLWLVYINSRFRLSFVWYQIALILKDHRNSELSSIIFCHMVLTVLVKLLRSHLVITIMISFLSKVRYVFSKGTIRYSLSLLSLLFCTLSNIQIRVTSRNHRRFRVLNRLFNHAFSHNKGCFISKSNLFVHSISRTKHLAYISVYR